MNTESTSPTDNPHAQSLISGQKLAGCYILQREISADPIFPVWLATDEVLGKEVSLYFIPKSVVEDSRGMSELRIEVKRNRQLIHPGIVRVYDLVEDGEVAAISMDRLDGESLASVLKGRKNFNPDEIADWLKQLAATLDDAHRVQLIHRDLAPSNIYMKPGGGVVLANFGISRCLRDSLERSRSISREDSHLSSMSPQQLDGDRPTKQDDIYGLGTLTFELLTRAAPFSGQEIVAAIRSSSAPAIREARGGEVPEAWERFVSACMAKKPEARPASCVEAVGIFSSSQTVTLAPPAPAPVQEQPVVEQKAAETFAQPASGASVSLQGATENAAPAKDEGQIPPVPPKSPFRPPGAKPGFAPNFPELERPATRWQPIAIVALLAGVAGYAIYSKQGDDASTAEGGGLPPGIEQVDDNNAANAGSVMKPAITPPEVLAPPIDFPDTTPLAAIGAPGSPESPDKTAAEIAVIEPSNPTPKPGTGPKPLVKKPLITIGATSPTPVAPPPVAPTLKPVEAATPPVVAIAPTVAVKPVLGAVKIPVMPVVPAKIQITPTTEPAELEKMLVERLQVELELKDAISNAEQAQQEVTAQTNAGKKSQEAARIALEDRRRVLAPAIRENEALLTDLKKREEDLKKAEAAAQEAKKAADAAKATLEAMSKESAAKIEAAKKADEELKVLALMLADSARQNDEIAKTQTQAQSLRQQAALGLLQVEKDKALLSAAIEKSRAVAAEAMRVKNQTKIAEIAKQMQPIELEIKKSTDVLAQLKDLGDAGAAASKPIEERLETSKAQLKKLRDEATALGGAPDAKLPPMALPEKKTEPLKTPPKQAENAENSLGMKFTKVGDVDFSVYLVTRKDFEVFAAEKGMKGGAWRSPGFAQEADHPVVNVTWKEADAFCKWLTDKERKGGVLATDRAYRLPTDMEWSMAAGLPAETGATPEARDLGVDGIFPWGSAWPPPAGAGNYAGEETNSEVRLADYRDEYQWTSPVGKFNANSAGLFDMGGNVWQWTADYFNESKERRVLRGGSWYNGGMRQSLLASCRYHAKPDESNDTYGFRLVRANASGKNTAAR